MKKTLVLVSFVLLAAVILSACGPKPAQTPVATEPPATEAPVVTEAPAVPTWTAPEGALVAAPVDSAPTLDGVAEELWANAQEIVIPVSGGINIGATEVHIKAIYTADSVYFLVTYADPTESQLRSPWVKQEDGTWKKLSDPNDKGGDNNTVYEDKMSFIWPIADSITNFSTQGCFTACHAGENPDLKPYGNKYTAGEGQMGDMWHWKSVRNLNQLDDQYLDWTKLDTTSADTIKATTGAGRKSDPKDSGGYVDNKTEDGKMPGFMAPNGGDKSGLGAILESEKVAFDDTLFVAGDMVPSIIISEFVGDRGNLMAGWKYENGTWTLEFGRLLDTASQYDVEFTDPTAVYYFAVAVFDNAQVRHAFEAGATPFVFQPK